MKKLALTFAATIPLALGAQGALIVNGDFSSSDNGNSAGVDSNHLETEEVGSGWNWKSGWSLTATTGVAQVNAAGQTNDALAQANSVTGESGGGLNLSLKWTAVLGSASPDLTYQLVGWKGTLGAGGDIIRFINGGSDGVGGTGATVVDLLTGTDLGTGNNNATRGTVTGTAGATNDFSIDIDLSAYAAGLSDVSDYDYIGFRFNVANDDTTIGSQLDDVSVSAIPEPSAIALLGLGALGLVARRRR